MSDTTPTDPVNPVEPDASTDRERLVRQETRQGNTEARQGTSEARQGNAEGRLDKVEAKADKAEGKADAAEHRADDAAARAEGHLAEADGRMSAIEALADSNIKAMEQVQALRADIAALVARDNRRGQQMRKNRTMAAAALVVLALIAGVDRRNVARADRDRIATDRTFCMLANDNRMAINATRAYLRADQEASKRAYALALAPQESDDQQTRTRKVDLLRDLLETVDAAPVGGDLPVQNCESLTRGKIEPSITTSTPTTGG